MTHHETSGALHIGNNRVEAFTSVSETMERGREERERESPPIMLVPF